MRMTYSMVAAVTVLFTGLVSSGQAADDEPDIAGMYKFVGDVGDGKTYSGTVKISKEGDSYLLRWKTTTGQIYLGLALREGNILSVAIRDEKDDKYTGIIVYKIQKGPKLVGRWTTSGFKGKTLTETLTKEE